MTNPNKAKGTRWESAVRDYFCSTGGNAHRIAQAGVDVGDVHVDGLFALQCKNVAQQRYAQWVPEAEAQARAAGMKFAAVVHKRRQARVGEALVVMSLDQFESLVQRLRVVESMTRGTSHARSGLRVVRSVDEQADEAADQGARGGGLPRG